MKYKYILFDIDNTLIDFNASFKNAARKVIELGGGIASDDWVDTYFKLNDDAWFGLRLDQIEDPDIIKNYHPLYYEYINNTVKFAAKELGLKGLLEDLLDCSNRSLGEQAVINPHVFQVLEKLKKDHTLCIATNGLTCIQPHKVKHFESYMSHVFISEEMNFCKPQKEYFDYIINVLGCKKKDCLMVGDSLANDIGGANNAGIHSCYYNPGAYNNCTDIKPTYEISDFIELLDIV